MEAGDIAQTRRAGHDAVPRPGHWGAASVAHRAAPSGGAASGRERVCWCAGSRSPRLRTPASRWTSKPVAIDRAWCLTPSQWPPGGANVPRYLPKANFPHGPISWERNFPAPRFGNSVMSSQYSTAWRRAAAVVFSSTLTCSVSGFLHKQQLFALFQFAVPTGWCTGLRAAPPLYPADKAAPFVPPALHLRYSPLLAPGFSLGFSWVA
jgi:hypothetical protein